jgi:hypothetical protein
MIGIGLIITLLFVIYCFLVAMLENILPSNTANKLERAQQDFTA